MVSFYMNQKLPLEGTLKYVQVLSRITRAQLILPSAQILACLCDFSKVIESLLDSSLVLVRRSPSALNKEDVLPRFLQTWPRVDTCEVQAMALEDHQSICQCTRRSMINGERDQSFMRGFESRLAVQGSVRLLKLQLGSAFSKHISQYKETGGVVRTILNVFLEYVYSMIFCSKAAGNGTAPFVGLLGDDLSTLGRR